MKGQTSSSHVKFIVVRDGNVLKAKLKLTVEH